jgi:hypothetical protein
MLKAISMFQHNSRAATLFSLFASILSWPTNTSQTCKTLPTSIADSEWNTLNQTVNGALISTAAYGVPGGVCYEDQPNFDNATCTTVQSEWFTTWSLATEHPVHNAYQNWNNDACWPFYQVGLKCQPQLGYPTYVINATTAAQVQAGINFARANNLRVIVKSSEPAPGGVYVNCNVCSLAYSRSTANAIGKKSNLFT